VRILAGLAAAAALLLVSAAPAAAAGWTNADYFAFADRVQERMEPYWISWRGLYRPGNSSLDTMVNANLLLVHSAAARAGHTGLARQDRRARRMARELVASPPFIDQLDGRQLDQEHAPGWVGSTGTTRAMQHLVVDAEVAEALAVAWRARDVLQLPPETVAAIEDRLRRVSASAFWRWPTLRLNQINWYATVYAAAAEVTGDPTQLRRDLRNQVRRFAARILRPQRGTAGNLGPGMRFHYLPDRPASWKENVENAEYANIVASFVRGYHAARRRGMPAIPAGEAALLRRWLVRVLAGYWTHAGYLNWDTGLGFARWHQAKKLPLAQQALIGLAAGGSLVPGDRESRWAKALLDRGFAFYARQLPEGEGLPPGLYFDVRVQRQAPSHSILAASRMAANAARAVEDGLGSRPSALPPPLYAFDPDTGRLAVTTPRYNTAIFAVSRGAFPYGGLDLARLYDGRQEVAAGIGGLPPASFGMVVRDGGGRVLLATQRPRPGGAPLRLVEAPAGVGASPRARPDRAFAGPFRSLVATGAFSAGPRSARSTYRFARNWIEGTWTLTARGRGRHTVDVLFPSWGGKAAWIEVVGRDGSRRRLERERSLAGVRRLVVHSERGSYAVVPRLSPRGATVRLLWPGYQPSNPRPGPTVAVGVVRRARAGGAVFRARLEPGPAKGLAG
jgi:hypothetical protein